MRILLDTHIWLWMILEPDRLSPRAVALLNDGGNLLFLSAASTWEMSIKHASGKLPLPAPPEILVPSRMRRDNISPLPITMDHTFEAGKLPKRHADPFDRLLVAQSIVEGMTLMTVDDHVLAYGGLCLDARV